MPQQNDIRSMSDLRADERNPRSITKDALRGLTFSLAEYGDLSGIVFNVQTGELVCGHQRVKALTQKYGDLAIAGDEIRTPDGGAFKIRTVDWPRNKQMAANVAANAPTIQGDFTDDIDAILREIRDDDPKVFESLLLDDLLVAADSEDGKAQGLTDPDELPEVATPVSKVGDLWILGGHRVLCGDSAIAASVDMLLAGTEIDMLLSDPPYGVSYVGKTKDALTVTNDHLSEESLAKLMLDVFNLAQSRCRPGAYWYATVPGGPLYGIFADDWKRRGILRQQLIWAKDSMVLGHSEYHYRHEPILFGWVEGPRHKNKDRTRTTLWECDRPKASREHPTMKPVALWERAMTDGSRKGEAVYDPFLGSGTTVIAAETLGRHCYGVELDPQYVDVIVKRWCLFTGKDAILESTGQSFAELEMDI